MKLEADRGDFGACPDDVVQRFQRIGTRNSDDDGNELNFVVTLDIDGQTHSDWTGETYQTGYQNVDAPSDIRGNPFNCDSVVLR